MRHVEGFLQEDDCRIVGVCDVDAGRRRAAVQQINKQYGQKNCREYNDFRDLIARDDIDTLCISVPDHWHAVIAMAMILGRRIRWDPKREQIIDDPSANRMLGHAMRSPWRL